MVRDGVPGEDCLPLAVIGLARREEMRLLAGIAFALFLPLEIVLDLLLPPPLALLRELAVLSGVSLCCGV